MNKRNRDDTICVSLVAQEMNLKDSNEYIIEGTKRHELHYNAHLGWFGACCHEQHYIGMPQRRHHSHLLDIIH